MNDNGGSSDAGSVGERLMTALFRKKMSMRELSRKTGLCQPSISKWCRGKAEPKLEYSRKTSEVLEVSVDWLAFGLPKPSDHEGVARSGIIRPETDFSLAFSEGTAINLFGAERKDLTLFHLKKPIEGEDNVITEAFVVDMAKKVVDEAGYWLIRTPEGLVCRYVEPQGYTFVISEGECSKTKKVACEVTKLHVLGRIRARFMLEKL